MTPNLEHEYKQLGKAIAIVTDAFKDHFDRGGKPYILHCLHVMNNVDQNDPELMQIAVMHDLMEDMPAWTPLELVRAGFSIRVVNALRLMTHNKEDDYLEVYIKGISTNWDAVRVKREDLKHNGCVTRTKGKVLREKDIARYVKYITAFHILSQLTR